MRQFKAEFEAARASQNWPAVIDIFRDLLVVAGIEETDDGAPGTINKELAEKRNAERGEHTAYGIKI